MPRRSALVVLLALLLGFVPLLPRAGAQDASPAATDEATPVADAGPFEPIIVEGASVEVLGATTVADDADRSEITQAVSRITLAPGTTTPPPAPDEELASALLVVLEGTVEVAFVGTNGTAVVTPAEGTDLATDIGVCLDGTSCEIDVERLPMVRLGPGDSLFLDGIQFGLFSSEAAVVEVSFEFLERGGFVFPKPKPRLASFQ